eukprot:TRINITY_DN21336_c0_g1_i1.p1 TRINITY_DN21336_c0_g1~~TRINITY_DN21336_c0_g1_i1.p1  ORF type:complete len:147 (-),score=19.99 TRINITY_DN21336_c0_g1_i1:195-635(-)
MFRRACVGSSSLAGSLRPLRLAPVARSGVPRRFLSTRMPIPAKSAFHGEKDERIIDPNVPGKMFLVNVNAGAQAVDSIGNRMVAVIGTICLAGGMTLFWSVGMPTSFLSALGLSGFLYMSVMHVGHVKQCLAVFAIICLWKYYNAI